MLRVVVVAGKAVEVVVDKISSKETVVEKSFVTIEDLWLDVLENPSSYNYIDKIVVIATGFLPERVMPTIEQVMNVQSIIARERLQSDLYVVVKDTDLYEEVKSKSEEALIFRNMNMLIFKELNVINIMNVLKGKYDAVGLFHPDFLRKNEIDEQLKDAYDESDASYVEIEKTTKREIVEEFIDTNEDLQKEMKEKERNERRNRSKEKKEEPKKSRFGKKEKNDTSKVNINQQDSNLVVSSKKDKGKRVSKRNSDLFRGVIAFSGDRQSGISTTVANAATVYSQLGNSVLIIDLDMRRRSQSVIFSSFKESIELESRVAHGLLVSLANPKNLEDVVSVVDDNISVLSIDTEVEKEIKKFANRPIEQLFSPSNLVNLFSFAKSLYDVVLLDFPFELMRKVGSCLSYVDEVVLCIPNTEHHLNTLLEVELEELLLNYDLIGHTLMSKSSILLTKYNQHSKIYGKEATDVLIERILNDLEDPVYHLSVIGIVPLSFEYERQMDTDKRIVKQNRVYEEAFISFLENIR